MAEESYTNDWSFVFNNAFHEVKIRRDLGHNCKAKVYKVTTLNGFIWTWEIMEVKENVVMG